MSSLADRSKKQVDADQWIDVSDQRIKSSRRATTGSAEEREATKL